MNNRETRLDEGMRRGGGLPLDGDGELPRAWAGLDDNVGLLDAAGQQLLLGTGDEGLDDGLVPAGVDDGNAQAGALVVLGGRSLERHDLGGAVLLVVSGRIGAMKLRVFASFCDRL